jgi:hypothetical protein
MLLFPTHVLDVRRNNGFIECWEKRSRRSTDTWV